MFFTYSWKKCSRILEFLAVHKLVDFVPDPHHCAGWSFRWFTYGKVKFRAEYRGLSMFIVCGVASVLRRDIDPRSVDLKYIQVIFDAMLEGLMGASAPGI